MSNNNTDKTFFEINGATTFIKFKSDSFRIGKLKIAFVQYDKNTSKMLSNCDYYVDIPEALAFANDVLNGKIKNLCEKERAKGSQYPSAVWTLLGGVNEEISKKRGRTDGKATSRQISLIPGQKMPYVFKVEQRPGSTNAQGLIVPDKCKPEISIMVPSTERDIEKAALLIKAYIQGYINYEVAKDAEVSYFNNSNNNSNNNSINEPDA